jgi:hypothetical protein
MKTVFGTVKLAHGEVLLPEQRNNTRDRVKTMTPVFALCIR